MSMVRLAAVPAFLIVVAMAAADPARAQEGKRFDWKVLDRVAAQQRACAEARDKKSASGVTTEMRAAGIEYGICVEAIIEKVAKEFYAPEAFGKGGIAARIEQLRTPYQGAYWTIYNEAGPCGASCGTMYQPFHAAKWGELMESMLTDMVDHLTEYR